MTNYVDGMKDFLETESENVSKIPYKRILAVGDIHGHSCVDVLSGQYWQSEQ